MNNQYTWNGQAMWNTTLLPAAVGQYLRIASPLQLRVLLWFAACSQGNADMAACAAALGGQVTAADCEDALRFWVAEGLLCPCDGATVPSMPAVSAPAPVPPTPVSAIPTPAVSVAPKTATAPKVTATPPQSEANSPDFIYLLHETEARLGKTLSRADQDRLLDLYEEHLLPVEVLLMIVAYAVRGGKRRVPYIQTVARDWAERGIATIDAADKHLCYLERAEGAWSTLCEWLSLDVAKPSLAQKELAEKWICRWKQSKDLIAHAYDKCMARTGKFQAAFIDRILTACHEDGITAPEQLNGTKKPTRSKKKTTEGGFDLNKYEQLISAHTPTYRKKG